MPIAVIFLILFSLVSISEHSIANTVYTAGLLPQPFSYARCESLLNSADANKLSQEFDTAQKLGKCHFNADVTQDTLSLFNLSSATEEIRAEFTKIGDDKVLKLKDSEGKMVWQIPIPITPAYRSKPAVAQELEANYSNHFYDFVVLKDTPHIRLYLSNMNPGIGGLYTVGLDVTCEHLSQLLADSPVTAREYSVFEANGRRLCRIPVFHFYRAK